MGNTEISYMYRDAGNYKQYGSEVVRGELTYEQLAPYFLEMAAEDEGLFNPKAVGLGHPGEHMGGFPTEDDHDWCELCKDGVTPVDREPTLKQSAEELIELFRVAKENEKHGKNPSPAFGGA
jgi:hypothetical protein